MVKLEERAKDKQDAKYEPNQIMKNMLV